MLLFVAPGDIKKNPLPCVKAATSTEDPVFQIKYCMVIGKSLWVASTTDVTGGAY